MTRRLVSAAALIGVAFAASSCSLMKKEEAPPCPRVSILSDASKMTKFRPGQGRDLTDVVATAEIGAFTGSCTYKDNAVEVALQVSIDAERGPAAQGSQVDMAYFVAIPAYFPSPRAKAVLPVQVGFTPESNKVRFTDEEVVMTIPLKAGEQGANYEVFLGFQLSGDELDYNREQRR